MEAIPDHIRPGLKVLFVGYNPSLRSSKVGHHYANPNNRFWRVLHGAGLTDRLYKSEEGRALLDLGYGFTNIVSRPTRTAAEITKEEYAHGALQLRAKLERYRPRAACYVGKGVYEQFSGIKKSSWGWQPFSIVEGVSDFIAPSTSGLVRLSLDELVALFKPLAQMRNRLD
ncbi:G/U mismatch-specific DNA glycosylase [Paenibacillus sp. HJGM_3]|uniref:G/U mismatch-specific DNA glycosylase n=1 Tax=Paenibacillus sp. HJGM_3 TaxID=3379816 RepID=UPI00385E3A19